MKTQIHSNYSACGVCAGILEGDTCVFCKSVENANLFIAQKLTADNRPFPFGGFLALIIFVALTLALFTQCPKQSPQPVNLQTSRTK